MLPLQTRMNLGTMAMKGDSALPKAPALLDTHQFLSLCSDAVNVFYGSS